MVGRNPASNFKESKKINPFPPFNNISKDKDKATLCNPRWTLTMDLSDL